MNDLLQTVIFARYTVQDLLLAFGAAIALFAILGIARRLRGTSKDRHFENVICPDCGWRGKVSRYAGRCPRCNQPLGEQKARRGK